MMNRKTGLMISEIAAIQLPLILKTSGYDFCIIDYEHGGFDYKDIFMLIMNARLSGIKSIVRLAVNSRKDILKFMDMGADALLLPMTNNAEDIQKVVDYGKYTPIGKRGISTVRAHSFYNPGNVNTYIEKANNHTEIYAQIETISGVENIESILDVTGVNGFFIGPNDLSCEMNCLGDPNSQKIKDTIEYLASIAIKKQKTAGIITKNNNFLSTAKISGIEFYCVGSELSLLIQGGKETVAKVKEE